jgi:HEAT repeat protein
VKLADWEALVSNPDLPNSLYALRALARLGEWKAMAGPHYPLLWALSQTKSDRRDVVFLRHRRQPKWTVTRERCVAAVREASHPLQRLGAMVRLVTLHKDKAIPALLDGILHRALEPELYAWALGRLGRVIVPEVRAAWGRASSGARQQLAMALWYVGPGAAAAVPELLAENTPVADAALLAMEDRASLAMIEARRFFVWLDLRSVGRLAELAFDVNPAERAYAACALGGFGTADVTPVLKALLADPEPQVGELAAWALVQRGPLEMLSEALRLFPETAKARPDLTLQLLRATLDCQRAEDRLNAATQLRKYGLLGLAPKQVAELLEGADLETLPDMLRAVETCPQAVYPAVLPALHRFLAEGDVDVRQAALRCLSKLRAGPEAYLPLLEHPDGAVLGEAVRCLLLLGRVDDLPLQRLLANPEDRANLLSAIGAAGVWAAKLAPELIGLLDDPDPSRRKQVLRALGALQSQDPTVLAAIEKALADRSTCLAAAEALNRAWILISSPNGVRRATAIAALKDARAIPTLVLPEWCHHLYPETLLLLERLEGRPALVERLKNEFLALPHRERIPWNHALRKAQDWGGPAFEALFELLPLQVAADCLLATPSAWLWSHRDRPEFDLAPPQLVLHALQTLVNPQLALLAPHLPDLRRFAHHPDGRIAAPAIYALQRTPDECWDEVIELLLELLEHPQAWARLAALNGLDRHCVPPARLEALLDDLDEAVVSKAGQMLRLSWTPEHRLEVVAQDYRSWSRPLRYAWRNEFALLEQAGFDLLWQLTEVRRST